MENESFVRVPSIIREGASGLNQISVTDALMEKRQVFLVNEVNSATSAILMQQFMYLDKEAPGEPITFYINSPGGEVVSGLTLYDLIRMVKSPVTTVCIGRAASMGAILFLAAEKRLMLPHAEIMLHDASFGHAEFSGMKPDEIQEKTDDLMKTCKILRQLVSERIGKPLKSISAMMKKDSYFKADEAVSFGIATGIAKDY